MDNNTLNTIKEIIIRNYPMLTERQLKMSKMILKEAYRNKLEGRHDFLVSTLNLYKTYETYKEMIVND